MTNNLCEILKNFLAQETGVEGYRELDSISIESAFIDFARRNELSWKSDTEMDIKRMDQNSRVINFGTNFMVDVKDIFYNLSENKQKYFWELFCGIIQRDIAVLENNRRQELVNYATQFSNDLKNVNVSLTVEEVINMVIANKDRAQLRLLSMIEPKIDIPISDQDHFWRHYDNVYNCIYPYEPLTITPDTTIGLDKCLGGLSNIDASNINSAEDVIKTVLNPEMIQNVLGIMQDPERLKQMVNGMMPMFKAGFPNFNL